MATYAVTITNWNDPAFWASIVETSFGHTLDFSALSAPFNVEIDQASGIIRLSDGTTGFNVGEAGVSGTDANFGGLTLLDYFTDISGTQGDDAVSGTAGDDVLDGNSGADKLAGEDGADTLYGNGGVDRLDGGGGNDLIYGGADGDEIHGADGDDRLFGETGDDTILGGTGDDFITGNAGADLIYGGDGADQLEGGWEDDAADTIFGEGGNDLIFGYGGGDSLLGGTGSDWIDGGAGNDRVRGDADQDRIVGDLGSDTILGDAGYDVLTGGEGADSINGGADADQIWGNAGDTIDGGETGDDSDTLYVSHVDFISYTTAESGTITFNSGDTLSFTGIEEIVELTPDGVVDGTAAGEEIGQFYFDADGEWIDNGDAIGEGDGDSVRAGGGNDTIWSQDGDDTVHGEGGDDDIYLGSGNNVAFGGAGADTIDAEWGNDTISGDDFTTTGPNLIENGSFEDTTGMSPAGYGFSGPGGIAPGWTDANGNQIEFVNDGSRGLTATDGANWLDMEASAGQHLDVSQTVAGIGDGQVYVLSFDAADAANGDDGTTLDNQLQVIWNGDVVGTIDAVDGDWRSYDFHLIGGSGDGTNTLTFSGSGSADNQGVSLDNVQIYATTEAAGGADSLIGWDGDDDLMGGAGDDTIDGGRGADEIVAGSGDDSVLGGDGADTIYAGGGHDTVDGGDGADLIYGDGASAVDAVLVAQEDFTGGASGWTDNTSGNSAALGDFLGSFEGTDGDSSGGPLTEKTFDLADGYNGAVIEFDLLIIDSWDGNGLYAIGPDFDGFQLYVNGDQVANELFLLNNLAFDAERTGAVTIDGVDYTYSFVQTQSGPLAGSGSWDDEVWRVRLEAENYTGDQITIGFGSTTNQAVLDESFGIDNLSIVSTNDTSVALEDVPGNDLLLGGAQSDTIFGGAGNDTIDGGTEADTLEGGDGDDSITGGLGNDSILAGDGNDTVTDAEGGFTADGADTVDLGDGDDVFTGSGQGTADRDLVLGGAGNDTITVQQSFDTVFGGDGDDVITTLDESSGFGDELYGEAGNDTIIGANTNDTLDGGTGNDSLFGAGNTDTLIGGDGSDTLDGGTGDDSLDGGADADTFLVGDSFGNDTITGGEGVTSGVDDDTVDLSAVTADLTVDLTDNDPEAGSFSNGSATTTFTEIENIVLGGGRDTVVLADGSGSDVVNGFDLTDSGDGTTNDQLDVSGLTSDGGTTPVHAGDVVVTDTNGDGTGDAILTFPGGESLTLVGVLSSEVDSIDELVALGTPDARDFIVEGTAGADLIDASYTGDPEGDLVDAGDAADGSDDDVIQAGEGDDTVYAGAGNDSISGGSTGNDMLYGGDGDDTLWGLTGDDVLSGGAGNDSMDGGSSNDTLYGGTGDDWLAGGGENDLVEGGEGNDFLSGWNGDDTLFGGDGDDTLNGGSGTDSIDGGADADTFLVRDNFGNNTITGGEATTTGTDFDTIDLSALTAGVTVDMTGDETGTISNGTDTASFTEIENVTLGGGRDTVVLADGSGSDLVNGFDLTDSGDGSTNDQLDVSGLTSDGFTPVHAGDVTVSDTNGDGSGDAILTFPGGETLTLVGVLAGEVTSIDTLVAMGIPDARNFVVQGTSGNDLIDAGYLGDPQGDRVDAGDAADGSNDDVIDAGTGDDTVLAGDGADLVFGWTGSDSLSGEDGNDTLFGQDGDDTLIGGAGNDYLDGDDGSAGADSISGGDGDDTIIGDGGNDTLSGGADDDLIFAGADDDSVSGGTGDDQIFGDGGNDSIDAGPGNDTIFGGDGNDTIIGFEGNDSVEGGDGDDFINTRTSPGTGLPDEGYGTPGDALYYPSDADAFNDRDTVHGGVGNDTILTGDDNDIVFGGDGNDVVDAGFDDDFVSGGAGMDSLEGNEGNDTIEGGDENDIIYGDVSPDNPDYALYAPYELANDGTDLAPGNNADSLSGDAGNDTIYGQDDNDTLFGGLGDDYLDGGIDDDYLDGAEGADTLIGGAGNDTLLGGNDASADRLDGGDGNDELSAGDGNDTLIGGAGDDSMFAGAGADTLLGGAGDDTLDGWSGDDSIDAGTGDDLITGGSGVDAFFYSAGDGLDTITDFNFGNTGTLEDDDPSNNDRIDLSLFYDNIAELQDDYGDDGILNQSNAGETIWGRFVDYSDNTEFASGEGIVFLGQTPDGNSFTEDNTAVVCFTPGTLILTETGERPIESLKPGDRIVTRDNGVQALQWLARRDLDHAELLANPNLRPVMIHPDLVGAHSPLTVSPQHGMLVRPEGRQETLVRAIHLSRLEGGKARVAKGVKSASYIHLMFDAHQIIFANGAPSESLYPGRLALQSLACDARTELRHLFPDLFLQPTEVAFGGTARDFARFPDLPAHLKEIRGA